MTNLETESNLETDEIRDLDDLKKEIKLNCGSDNIEQIEKPVEPQVIIDAIFFHLKHKTNYFKYLWTKVKNKISNELKNYLSNHHILKIWRNNKVKLVMNIESKKYFFITMKKIINIIRNEINNNKTILKIVWIYKKIMEYIDKFELNLNNSNKYFKEMKMEEYMDLIFGDIGQIIRAILKKIKGKMTNGEYYKYFSNIYPNKNNDEIIELLSSKTNKDEIISDIDLNDIKYIGFK